MARALIVVALLCGVARADSAKLDDARQAITDVRYDDAQRLLGEALRDGDNSPAALAELYKLAASTAIVLDQHDVAERYYERWLALDPSAKVPTDLAPKLREPFIAAQAAMQAKGSLDVRVQRDGTEVVVEVVNDPLAMAVSVAVGSSLGRSPAVAIAADRHARVAAPWHATVLVLDDAGNHLRELPVPDPTPEAPPPVAHLPRAWTIGFVASGLIFVGFGIAAIGVDSAVTEDLATSEQHHLDDVDSLHQLERVFIGVTIVSGAAMIVCAVPVAASIFQHRDMWVGPAPAGVGLTVGGRW